MARALLEANTFKARSGLPHLACWEARERISPALREAFLATVAEEDGAGSERCCCHRTRRTKAVRTGQ